MPGNKKNSGRGQRELKATVKSARGKTVSQVKWLQRQLNDPYVKRAKAEGFRGRAAYKIMELDDKFNFLNPGSRVIDLGCAPGGWCQVVSSRVNALGNQKGKESASVKVKIPPGVENGQRVRVKGKGQSGPAGAGDLFVIVRVEPHHLFGREGKNLTVVTAVTFPELVLGSEVKVDTLEGTKVTLRIPSGTPNGRTFRVKGGGVSTPRGVGDLLVTVEVEIPIGLAGVSGIMTMKVTDQDIPPLIAGEFLKKLKANIDYEEDTVTWKKLGPERVSELTVLPSHHITCRIDQSSDGNWMDPRQAATVHRLNDKREYAETFSSVTKPQTLVAVDTLAQNQLSLTDYAVAPVAPAPPSLNHDVDVITTRASSWEPLNFCKLASHQSLGELLAEAAAAQYARDSNAVVAKKLR